MKRTALIVEDENSISNFLSTVLTVNNFNVIRATTGSEAFMMISSHCPDIVLLDLGLPDMDGQNIISKIREWSNVPIIVVSARSREKDKVDALNAGADDYITKPFGTSELIARVNTALRHANHSGNDDLYDVQFFICEELVVDFNKHHVYIDGVDVHLTQNEFKLVSLLAKHAGKVLTYDFLKKNIWGPTLENDNRILRVNMANIRRKIEKNPADPKFIFTEIGVGYRMADGELK